MTYAYRATALCALLFCAVSCRPVGPADPSADPGIEAGSGTEAPVETLASTARSVFDGYDTDAALAIVEAVDRYFRVRGNRGYHATLDVVEAALASGGFDGETLSRDPYGETRDAWSPNSASLILLAEEPIELHAFDTEEGFDRCSLLVGSASVHELELEVVDAATTDPADAAGRIVLTDSSPRGVWPRFATAGAAGILSYSLESYHRVDERDDIVSFDYLPGGNPDGFGFSISRATYETLQMQMAANDGVAQVQVTVDVERSPSRADVVEATIPGTDPDAGSVVFFTHIDEPGANDNASGTGALAELALTIRRAIDDGSVEAPRLNLIFLWGQEYESSIAWLNQHEGDIAAGLVLDMVGEDPAELGSPFLVERMPDPAAVWLRAPDEHTEWGAGYVNPDNLWGHYLNDVVIAASQEVAAIDGPWDARSNPFEGGSDHEPFLQRQIPSILGWHFTDDAYHTSYDRFDRVSADEMRRVAATVGSVALRIASASEGAAVEFADIVLAAATQRAGFIRESSLEALSIGSTIELESTIIAAWEVWYDEALVSVLATPGLSASSELQTHVGSARNSWSATVDQLETDVLDAEPTTAE